MNNADFLNEVYELGEVIREKANAYNITPEAARFLAALVKRNVMSMNDAVEILKKLDNMIAAFIALANAGSSFTTVDTKGIDSALLALAIAEKRKYHTAIPEIVPAYNYFKEKLPQVMEFLRNIGNQYAEELAKYNSPVTAALVGSLIPEVHGYLLALSDVLEKKYIHGMKVQVPQPPPSASITSSGDMAGALILNLLSPLNVRLESVKTARKIFSKVKDALDFVIKSLESVVPTGVPIGARPIRSLEEIPWLVPEEQAMLVYDAAVPEMSDYELYKILSGQAFVFERKAVVKPVIFIDKSGSMNAGVHTPYGVLTRYQLASTVAAALIDTTDTPISHIYLFDVTLRNLEEEINQLLKKKEINKEKMLRYLKKYKLHPALLALAIAPDGGTDINLVYETADALKKKGKGNLFVIVTDAEDYIHPEIIKKAMKDTNNKIYMIIVNERYHIYLQEAKRARQKIRKAEKSRRIHLPKDYLAFNIYMPAMYPENTIVLPPHEINKKNLRKVLQLMQRGVAGAAIPA